MNRFKFSDSFFIVTLAKLRSWADLKKKREAQKRQKTKPIKLTKPKQPKFIDKRTTHK